MLRRRRYAFNWYKSVACRGRWFAPYSLLLSVQRARTRVQLSTILSTCGGAVAGRGIVFSFRLRSVRTKKEKNMKGPPNMLSLFLVS